MGGKKITRTENTVFFWFRQKDSAGLSDLEPGCFSWLSLLPYSPVDYLDEAQCQHAAPRSASESETWGGGKID